MNTSNPLVSVVIPTYKRSEKLPRAVKSVLNQTYTNVEVLVVSDNEPDDQYTADAQKVVDSFNDPRVILVKQEHHKNGAAARNAGIKVSTGELIAFLDDDDFWDKEKLEIQVPTLLSLDESWGGVSCLNKIFRAGVLIKMNRGYKSGYLYRNILLRRFEISTDTVLLRKDYLLKSGLYDERLRRHQEVQLFTFFTYQYKMYLINKHLCNVDIDDARNRPTPEKMIEVKKNFLASVEPIMDKMSRYERYSIRLANYFELGGAYFLHHLYLKGIVRSLSILTSPLAFCSACIKMIRRFRSGQIPKEFKGRTIEYFEKINNLT